jgi:hypothetical protein
MANIHRHIVIRGLTDVLGDWFLERNGYSLRSKRAGRRIHADSQAYASTRKTHQDLLREATGYANFAQTQDVYVHIARRADVTAYSIALTDWFEGPRVLEIDVDAWTGMPGETIRIKARDNVKVAAVRLEIRDADGNLLETGEAVQSEADRAWWRYTTHAHVSLKPFPSVEAIARDLPGNQDSFVIN